MTSLPVLQNRIQPPDCFGLHWDPKVAECAGGLDVMYTNKNTGSHHRERCQFFESCGAKLAASRTLAQKAMVPIQSFTFPAPPQAPQISAVSAAAARAQQVAPMSQQMMPYMQHGQQQMMPMVGPWHPAPTYQFNHGIPNYLSTPEPRPAGESIWVVLFRELLRAVIKSAGHTVSYFADTTPMRNLPPGPQ